MADDAKKIHRCGRCGDQLADHGSYLPGLFRCADGTDTPWAEFRLVDPGVSPDVIRLLAASSFGTPEAIALRNSVTDEQVDRVMRRVQAAGAPITDDERQELAEELSYDRCEYGCARSVAMSTVERDIEPWVARVVAARVTAVLDDMDQLADDRKLTKRLAKHLWFLNTGSEADPWRKLDADERENVVDSYYADQAAEWFANELRERVARHRGGA